MISIAELIKTYLDMCIDRAYSEVFTHVCFQKRLGWIAEIWVQIGCKESAGVRAESWPLIGQMVTLPASHWSAEARLCPRRG